jgi:hypothetical protein
MNKITLGFFLAKSKLNIKGLLALFVLMLFSELATAQPWTYDFGTGTGSPSGSFTSTTASTSYLPAPSTNGGTSRVRVGTNPGSIALVNPGIAIGTGSELQITSNTGSTSTTKFSVYDYTTATKVGYVKFTISLNGGTNGVYQFSIGDGTNYSDNSAIGTAQIFSGIRWSFGASNSITYNVLNSATYGTTGITNSTTLFSQSTSNSYIVEVYFNNETTSQNYGRSGSSYAIASGKWDMWISGTLIGDDLARGGMGNNAIIDSWAFNHQSSSTSPGTVYLDDIEYSNSLPAAAPVITTGSPTGTVGTSFSYSIVASGTPTGYALSTGSLPAGLSLNTTTGAITGTPTAVGTTSPTFTANNGSGTSPAVALNFTISKGSSTITASGTTSFTYTGSAQGPASSSVTGSTGAVSYSYSGVSPTSYSASATAPTVVGTYKVNATVDADTNYNAATSADHNFAITKASSSITATGSTSFTYTGSAQGPASSSVTGSTGAVSYSYSGVSPTIYSASATAPSVVGTYEVIATVAADTNYNTASSTALAFSIVAVVPGAPTSASAIGGDTQASVSFTAPTFTGGTAITGYTVTATGSPSITATGASSPIAITGLTNGTPYTFTVTATNDAGTGLASGDTNSVTPAAGSVAPHVPTALVLTPTDGGLSVNFTPGFDGGSVITDYEYSTDDGVSFEGIGTTTVPFTISGLTNTTTYQVQIRAVNINGSGTATASVSGTPGLVPDAPSINSLATGNAQLTVNFSAPAYNGGSTITNYQYSTDGGSSFTAVSPASTTSPIVITELTNGTSYTIKIKAVNAIGASAASGGSSATPATTAAAPTGVVVTPGNASLSVAFSAPVNTGGSAIQTYKYSTDGGATFITRASGTTASPIDISTLSLNGSTALTNGTSYNIQIQAVNGVGDGTATASVSGTPGTTPGAPSITSITGGNTQLSVAFTAPASDGGNAISNYQYSTDNGVSYKAFSPAQNTSPLTITTISSAGTALVNYTAYTVLIKAVNSFGAGTASGSASGTPALIEPTNQVTNFAKGTVTTAGIPLTWTAAAAGSQAPTGYLVKLNTGTVVDPVDGTDPANITAVTDNAANRKVTTGSATSTTTFTGMVAGTMYNYKIYSYSNTGTNINFNTTSAPAINVATLPNAVTAGTFTANGSTTATIGWTLASGYSSANHSTLVFVKATSAVTAGTPTNAPSTYTASTTFGSGNAYQGDAAAYCVYNGDSNTVALTGLSANTAYNVYIVTVVDASNSDSTNSYSAGVTASGTTLSAAVSVPYTQGFESTTTEWNLATAGTNKWAIGAATNNGGTKGLYISNNSGTANAYTLTSTQSGTDAAVRVDLTGLTAATLSFDWKSNGEADLDYGEVYINTGASDVLISTAKEFQATTAFAAKTISLTPYVGGIVTIKFRWINDNSQGSAPFAVDNVSVVAGGYAAVTTTAISTIDANTATGGGAITDTGGSTIVASGICWSTATAPTTANSKTTDGATTATSYSGSITGLLSNTTYYVRAYATNTTGTAYGPEVSFTTTLLTAPVATAATSVTTTGFAANWETVTGASSGYLLDVSTSATFTALGAASVTEGFESGLTGSYVTGNATLGTGTWALTNVLGGTAGVNNGTKSAQLQSATNSALISPSFSNVSTVSFYVTSSTAAGGLQVNYSTDGGSTWNTATGSPFTALGTAKTLKTATINSSSSNVILQFRRTAATIYLDDITINHQTATPSFVSGYNAKAISGQSTVSSAVTGLSAGTTYYYRVRATDGTASTNSNVITVATKPSSVTWNGSAWSNTSGPDADIDAIITGNYSVAANITAKTLTVNNSAVATIPSGNNVTVTGAVTVTAPATLTFDNNANLIQGGTTNTNTGDITVKRNSSLLKRLDYTLWSSPVASQKLAAFTPLTNLTRFYTYNPAKNLYSTILDPTVTNFASGTGYLIRMPNENPADLGTTSDYYLGNAAITYNGQFTGIPNNGTLTLSDLTADKFYAVGNPYPSTISADAFINVNSTAGTLYFWRKRNAAGGSAYATYNLVGTTVTAFASGNGSLVVPNGTIQVGQGFIVKTAATSLAFTNAMRVANNDSQFFKTKQVQKDRIWLNLTRPATKMGTIDIPEAFSQALIGYMDGATLGLDEGIDGKYINDSEVALTSSINAEEYTIQGRPAFDPADVVALNFKTDADSEYTIALDHFDGVFAAGQDVYLVDSKTGTETDLKTGAYTFNATSGIDNTRFSLKYQKTLRVDAPAFNENSVSVYKNNGALYVNSGFVAMSNIKVFDIQGRLVAEQKNLKSTTAVFNNLRAKNQVLIVKITGANNNVVTKKIVN